MKKENILLTNRFFLLSNGDVVFLPKGLKRNQLLENETEAKVLAFEYGDDGVMRICPIRIEASAYDINKIEEKEKIFFKNHKHQINYFYRNLAKVDHGYKPDDMYEKVQELMNFNRIKNCEKMENCGKQRIEGII